MHSGHSGGRHDLRGDRCACDRYDQLLGMQVLPRLLWLVSARVSLRWRRCFVILFCGLGRGLTCCEVTIFPTFTAGPLGRKCAAGVPSLLFVDGKAVETVVIGLIVTYYRELERVALNAPRGTSCDFAGRSRSASRPTLYTFSVQTSCAFARVKGRSTRSGSRCCHHHHHKLVI